MLGSWVVVQGMSCEYVMHLFSFSYGITYGRWGSEKPSKVCTCFCFVHLHTVDICNIREPIKHGIIGYKHDIRNIANKKIVKLI